MKLAIALVLIFAFIGCTVAITERSARIVNIVNNHPQAKWVAGHNKFSDMKDSEIAKYLGTYVKPKKYFEPVIPQREPSNSLPTEFDSRTQWPGCVHPIRDQARCGSCWAFAGSEVLSDRFCIKSGGKVNVTLSPQDLVSCDNGDMGCNGGRLGSEWSYMESTGIVTDECMPYTSGDGQVASCPSACKDGSPFKKYKAKSYSHVGGFFSFNREEDIMKSIVNDGPVEGAFYVYQDFMNYKSGVYHHVTGSFLGGHAIKIIGYGVSSDGTKYWIVANSWGTTWGQNGFFWIQKGSNECELESQVYEGMPLV